MAAAGSLDRVLGRSFDGYSFNMLHCYNVPSSMAHTDNLFVAQANMCTHVLDRMRPSNHQQHCTGVSVPPSTSSAPAVPCFGTLRTFSLQCMHKNNLRVPNYLGVTRPPSQTK
jgi:hypothetical protein